MRKLVPIAVVIAVGFLLGQHFQQERERDATETASVQRVVDAEDLQPEREAPRQRPDRVTESTYRCDGRKHCSQMRSCEEATWFIENCSGVEMDGDNDGIPCERQWCNG
jgi:hypothetical protein